jgi:hypothetical protein
MMPPNIKTDDQIRQVTSDNGLPEAFSQSCDDLWYLCGEGIFSWSVFRFYRARLLTQTGAFDSSRPFLLDLQYLRALTGQQIVSTSIDEIARLSDLSAQQRAVWSEALNAMIPNVTLGDRLLGWFVPGSGVQFFSATHQLGQIQDPEFVRMFSAIWLDERTRSPQLRLALLGPQQLVASERATAVSGEVGA